MKLLVNAILLRENAVARAVERRQKLMSKTKMLVQYQLSLKKQLKTIAAKLAKRSSQYSKSQNIKRQKLLQHKLKKTLAMDHTLKKQCLIADNKTMKDLKKPSLNTNETAKQSDNANTKMHLMQNMKQLRSMQFSHVQHMQSIPRLTLVKKIDTRLNHGDLSIIKPVQTLSQMSEVIKNRTRGKSNERNTLRTTGVGESVSKDHMLPSSQIYI